MQLSALHYIPWLGSVLAECALLGIMLNRKQAKRFPFFFASIAYDVVRQAILAIVLAKFKSAYFAAYWLSIPLEYTLAFAVAYEVFGHGFKADIKVDPRVFRVFIAASAILLVIAAAFVFHPTVPVKSLTQLILILDRSSELLRCSILAFIWLYAAKLGISWRHHVFGIAFGLGMYSGLGLIVATVDAAVGEMCGRWLVLIPHYAYFVATLIWPLYLLRKEPARTPLTMQQLHFYDALMRRGQEAISQMKGVIRDKY
jgi:hypothetical protein